jgi:hypothetical protein
VTKLTELITESGARVEAHRCAQCGGIHLVERNHPLGILVIPCPKMPEDKVIIGTQEFYLGKAGRMEG